MERTLAILFGSLASIGLVWFLRSRMQRSPRNFWVLMIHGVHSGPRINTAQMTNGQLLESGIRFFTLGLIFMCALCAEIILDKILFPHGESHGLIIVLTLLTLFFCSATFLGSLYLLLNWAFRRKSYVPPPTP